jgi:hypothetical protein
MHLLLIYISLLSNLTYTEISRTLATVQNTLSIQIKIQICRTLTIAPNVHFARILK